MIGLVLSTYAHADWINKMPVNDYLRTDLDFVYEVKTDKYDKILLDCQGFVKGMRFYYNNQEERLVYMDEDLCEEVNQFLQTSKDSKQPVCLELNADENSIVFSRETKNCQ